MRKKIMPVLDVRLAEYGFKRRRTPYDTFIKKIDCSTMQCIGFNVGHGHIGEFFLSPSIGVTYKDMDDIRDKLHGWEPKGAGELGGGIGLPLGYLMPENTFIEWRFSRNEDVTDEANNMADKIIKYGLPVLEELSNRNNVIHDLEIGKYPDLDGTMLPIFHYLNGNIKRAFECIDKNIKKYSKPDLEEYEIEILKKLAADNGEVYVENSFLPHYLKLVDNFKKMVEEHKDNSLTLTQVD